MGKMSRVWGFGEEEEVWGDMITNMKYVLNLMP